MAELFLGRAVGIEGFEKLVALKCILPQLAADPDAPFAFCGPATYQSHEGDRPIAITWRLHHPLPGALYQLYATLEQG